MRQDERIRVIKELLFDYVKSPSLRHIRDPHSVTKLAREIVTRIDRGDSIWGNWTHQRERLLKSALPCWIPIDDMRDFLNGMPGPQLTRTDVEQRLRAFEEEEYFEFPKDVLKSGCLELYEKEKAEGTELPAIVGLLRDHVEQEEERLRLEHEERYRQAREREQIQREQRLMSGADCGWTLRRGSKCFYSRQNGRAYRLSPTHDKTWKLERVGSTSDDEEGVFIGRYGGRREATKVVAEVAYNPEPEW